MRVVPTVLISVDEDLRTIRLGATGGSRQDKRYRHIRARREIQGDGGAEESHRGALETEAGGGGPFRVVEPGKMPANTFTVQTIFVVYTANWIEIRLAAGGTGEAPVSEAGCRALKLGLENTAWVQSARSLVVAGIVVDDEENIGLSGAEGGI